MFVAQSKTVVFRLPRDIVMVDSKFSSLVQSSLSVKRGMTVHFYHIHDILPTEAGKMYPLSVHHDKIARFGTKLVNRGSTKICCHESGYAAKNLGHVLVGPEFFDGLQQKGVGSLMFRAKRGVYYSIGLGQSCLSLSAASIAQRCVVNLPKLGILSNGKTLTSDFENETNRSTGAGAGSDWTFRRRPR